MSILAFPPGGQKWIKSQDYGTQMFEQYPVQINTNILNKWLTGRGKQPVTLTWATLVEVLHDIELSNLAGDISTSKCPSEEQTASMEMHTQ